MKRSIQIFLGNGAQPIGLLHFEQRGARERTAFEYTTEWLGAVERFAIDPTLQLVPGPQFHGKQSNGSVFHAAIADTEPDGWGKRVIQRDQAKRRELARRTNEEWARAPLGSLDFLLAVDDETRLGALRCQDESGEFCRTAEPGRRRTPPLVELAVLAGAVNALETNSETPSDLAYLRGRGTSLGGLRPKCGVIDDDDRLCIAKFPSVNDERPVTHGEVLALHLAKRAGINAAEARLVESDGVPVALIRRFDRTARRGRVMYISAATLLGVERGDAGEHAYTEMVDAIRQHGAHVQADIDELWRRMAFSILITNVDDHLFNHGFLHVQHGQWRLAPAFDINPFPERMRELKTWLSEEAGPQATIDGLMSTTTHFRLSLKRAKEILRDVENAVAMWRSVGKALGMSPAQLNLFADAFEHEERVQARRTMA